MLVQVIHSRPRMVYEQEDPNGTHLEGQFYQEELSPLRITSRTTYKIHKIIDKRVKRGIREILVRWQGYSQAFGIVSLQQV